MVELFKEFQEVCVDKLTQTEGAGLQVTANINSAEQIDLVMEGFIYSRYGLNSRYVSARNEMLLRLTKSFNGKTCNDIVEVAKAPRFNSGMGGLFGGGNEE